MAMIIPLAMLAILAFVVIRSLMGVVAREDASTPAALAVETALPVRTGDDVRGFLLPAVGDAAADDEVTVDLNAADVSTS